MKTVVSFICAFVAALVLLPMARAADPWDVAFTGDPKAIMEAARAVPVADDQDVLILLEQHQYSIDDSGKTVSKIRKVFRVIREDAIDDWSSVEREYQPWHENKPELRARVISADGNVHWLDPKTIADSQSSDLDSSTFSDRRILRAPLPAVARGAVVEYEIVVRETAPLLDAGVTRRITIFDAVPIQHFRLSIQAGKNISLKTTTQLIPETAIQRRALGGSTYVECELGPISARKTFEANLPSDISGYPYLTFSTGRSWQDVATRYEGIVDQQIRAADLKSMLDGTDLTGTPLVIATRLAAKLHKEIRYTGVEFGEAEIIPRTPEETLKRKYGDCKDKAALLVAMLRMAGLKAYVALLSSGFGTDIDADVPGLGFFDHAIVYVAGDSPLWIDATSAETRVGEIPPGDQGRRALIASRATTALVRTPETPASENSLIHTIEIRMSDFGAGEFRETIEAKGSMETRFRQLYDGNDEKKVKDTLDRYVKKDFLAKSVGQFTATRKDDFTSQFLLTLQATNAKRAITEQDDAAAVLFPYLVFQDLPYVITGGLRGDQDKTEPRKHDFVFFEPYRAEYHYHIFPPATFKAKSLPTSGDMKLGPVEFSRNYQTNTDGTIDVTFRLDTGNRRINPAEFEALRDGLKQQYKQVPEVISFTSEASDYVALGEIGKAVKLVSANAAKHDDQLGSQVRLSRMLVTSGAVESAITVAKKLMERDPPSSEAWQALGWAYQHDSFGRRFRGDWNPAEAEKCYREAIKLDPEDVIALTDLAILLEHNSRGQRYGSGARLDEAILLYKEVMKNSPASPVAQNLAIALLYAGRYPEARDEAKNLPTAEAQATISTVAIALSESASRAIIESQRSYVDPKVSAQILVDSSQVLTELRKYDIAVELLKAAARLVNFSGLQTRVDLLAKMKRAGDAFYQSTDPRYPVQQVILELMSDEPNYVRLRTLFANYENWEKRETSLIKLRREMADTRAQLESSGFTLENLVDYVASVGELEKEGDETRGYRVHGSVPIGGGNLLPMYVIRESGEYKILAYVKDPAAVGNLALDLLAHNDIPSAQWWLDKAVADLHTDSSNGTGGPSARFLWAGVVPETRGPDAIKVGAASLIGRYSTSEMAIQLLKNARAKTMDELTGAQLDLALCEGLAEAQKWNDLLIVARRLATTKLFSGAGFLYIVKAESGLKQWKELQSEAERKLKTNPLNSASLQAMATSMIHSGDRIGAAEFLKRLIALPYLGQEEELFEAWNSMLLGRPDQDLLARLNRTNENNHDLTADYWYTLGTLQAYLGKPEEAQRSLSTALDHDDFTQLDARPWVLSGKILEQYGLKDSAQIAYRKARSISRTNEMADWALLLTSQEPSK